MSGLLARLDAIGSRWSDRLNPVLVREVQQAMRGRFFPVFLTLALLVMLITVSNVLIGKTRDTAGESILTACLVILGPMLICILPMQTFQAMQREVEGGSSELLLLSNLTPGRIVRGKLYAAMIHVIMWLSIFAPVMSLTVLLRGVSVVDVVTALAILVGMSLAVSSVAIGFGALARTAQFRVASFAGFFIVILIVTIYVLAASFSLMRRFGGFGGYGVVVSVVTSALAFAGLFLLVGAAVLSHPYENRSTPLRSYFFALAIAFAGICAASRGKSWELDPNGYANMMAWIALLFFLFAATEPPRMSLRVRRSVPKSPVLAFLATPFLPGGGRGFAFSALMALVIVFLFPAIGSASWSPAPWRRSGLFGSARYGIVVTVVLYAVVYAGLGCILRRILAKSPHATRSARVLTLLVIVVGAVLPLIVAATLGREPPDILIVLNPIWAIDRVRSSGTIHGLLTLATLLTVAFNAITLFEGFREVQDASAERRSRAGSP